MNKSISLLNRVSSGFTLVEILVVTFIIILLSGIVLANYGSTKGRFALERSTQRLAQDLRRAEEMAMSTQKFEGSVPPGGYGIYFDSSEPYHYILFADSDGDGDGNYSGPSEQVENISLESKVKIKSLAPTDPLTVIFIPPDPQLSGGPGIEIELCLEADPSRTKTIEVYQSGLISTP